MCSLLKKLYQILVRERRSRSLCGARFGFCFWYKGVVLSTGGILSNLGEGGGHGVCGVWLLSFAAIK